MGSPSKTRATSASSPVDHAIAGIVSGGLACVIVHPFDIVKTQLQVKPHYRHSLHVIKDMIVQRGWRSLWQGLSPNLTGNTVAWGTYFYSYNWLKDSLKEYRGTNELSTLDLMAAANLASLGTLTMTNPIWVVKTRMFLQDRETVTESTSSGFRRPHYTGLIDGLRRITAHEGVRGLYSGFAMGLVNVSHGGFQFSAYEKLKNWRLATKQEKGETLEVADRIQRFSIRGDSQNLSLLEFLSVVVASKSFAGTLTYPVSVIRARMQDTAHSADNVHRPKLSVKQCIQATYADHGIRSFYRGLPVHLLRVTPHTCLLFLMYEQARTMLADFAIDDDVKT